MLVLFFYYKHESGFEVECNISCLGFPGYVYQFAQHKEISNSDLGH